MTKTHSDDRSRNSCDSESGTPLSTGAEVCQLRYPQRSSEAFMAALSGVCAQVRLLGAEIVLLAEELRKIKHYSGDEYLPQNRIIPAVVSAEGSFYLLDTKLPLDRVESHVQQLARELTNNRWRTIGGDVSLEVDEKLEGVRTAKDSLRQREITIEDFISNVWKIHQELCDKLMFTQLPSRSRELELSLIEFNTDFSGLPFMLIDTLKEIDSSLLIDPTLGKPQEGFGRTMTDEEAERLLRSVGSRVFLLQSKQEIVGYFMFLPEPTEDLLPIKGLPEMLKDGEFLAAESEGGIGFARSVAVKKEHRFRFARAGTNACDLLDDVMAHTALLEGCDTLVATVRVGPNANASVKSHERHGWRRTGITVEGQLEILVRDIARGQAEPIETSAHEVSLELEAMPKSERWRATQFGQQQVLDAEVISDLWVEGRARAVAEQLRGREPEVRLSHHDGKLEVAFDFGVRSITMSQLRPTFDLWQLSINDFHGTLEESLNHLKNVL